MKSKPIKAGADTEEGRLDRAYKLGQSVGIEEVAGLLMEQAKLAFQRRDDRTAGVLRARCVQFERLGHDRHPGIPKAEKE